MAQVEFAYAPAHDAAGVPLSVSVFADRPHLREQICEDAVAAGFRLGQTGAMDLLFAYLAGLLTLINPCVLPILPIVLASAVQVSRAGPLALAAGLSLSFVVLGVGVAAFGRALGLTPEVIAQAGAWLMVGFGVMLLVPRAASGLALATGGLATDAEDGSAKIGAALETGAAAERFGEMVAELGGPSDFVERWRDRLPAAPVVRDITAGRDGIVTAIDGFQVGMAVVELGGGRKRGSDKINPAVGFSNLLPLGEVAAPDTPLARVHAADTVAAEAAVHSVREAYTIGDTHPAVPPLLHERIA